MKKKFKFYPRLNQYAYKHSNYMIYIDKEDFKRMSDLEVANHVNDMLKQTSRKTDVEDIATDKDIENAFSRMRSLVNSSFQDYFHRVKDPSNL
jgi:hypothetical protein